MNWHEALGFLAGAIITFSALPRIVAIIRNPEIAGGESITRNALLCIGNFLWVLYGIPDKPAIAIMCGIACILNGLVLAFAVIAQRRNTNGTRRRTKPPPKSK